MTLRYWKMASSAHTDLFTFTPYGKKPLKEQVTPHKIALLTLVYEYCELKRAQIDILPDFGAQPKDSNISEREKRDFMTTALKLLQSPDLKFYDEGVLPLMDFFQELAKLLNDTSTQPVISGSSVLGIFLRRMILAFEKLSFSQVTKLYTRYKLYFEEYSVPQAEDSEAFGGSLMDSVNSISGHLTRSALGKPFDHSHLDDGKLGDGGGFYSQKQAEYFISRQGFLLKHNENEALTPIKLQERITDMLKSNPDIAEAYCTSLHNLYHYFDRNTNIGGDSNKNPEDDISRRYAALNLAALHYRLGHNWLHRLEEPGASRTAILMARSVAKSGEISLPNLTSLSIQALARHNALVTAKPAREMCSVSSQLVLNLDTSEGGIYHNGEPVCIALCNMAKFYANNGQYSASLDIINNAKNRFPSNSQYASIWMICEQEVLFDRYLLNGKWGAAEQNAILNKEKGEVTEALSVLHKLLEKCKTNQNKYIPEFRCRILLTLTELYIQTGNNTSAISHTLDCISFAKEHHHQYIVAIATVHLAYIQMKLSVQAINLLDKYMIHILSHGSVFDKARTMYCYTKCLVGAKAGASDRISGLNSAVSILNTVIEYFRKIEAFGRVKDAIYFQARLYHELGYMAERNKCAYQFKQLNQQYPTLLRMSVNAL
ncbi:hypothetical protein KUTeg_021665 [Tegillarca granosa]|uniref:Anaphase-promoting complex subunit 5 n=1 Tax=Tegillarca granosa TaxID=220873 RepID=A0ABQ9E8L8_TEGGR|nr:hypothetical protein KUTeg_021665 [Tegillarca granosa]